MFYGVSVSNITNFSEKHPDSVVSQYSFNLTACNILLHGYFPGNIVNFPEQIYSEHLRISTSERRKSLPLRNMKMCNKVTKESCYAKMAK